MSMFDCIKLLTGVHMCSIARQAMLKTYASLRPSCLTTVTVMIIVIATRAQLAILIHIVSLDDG